jgi:hypothetical protein
MNIIKDEKITYEGDKVILTTTCAGDIGYIKELQYIKMQSIIDIMGDNNG